MALLLGMVVHAHLVAVVARSHLNAEVFARHRGRFVLLPLGLFGAMLVSDTVAIAATVLIVVWDVYHSALQTFGLGRIYDRLGGNDPHAGRRLDLGLNLLLYVGPIVAGASLLAHVEKLEPLADVGLLFFAAAPAHLASPRPWLLGAVGGASALYLVVYVLGYVRLWQRGHRVSFPKVFLLTTTALCSVWVWGTNPWGMAFFIMNLFHAVQYLALVWWSERGRLRQRLRLDRARFGGPATLALFLGLAALYGLGAEVVTDDQRALWCLTQVVALMHFFYDGFIWSVRQRHVG
ncbi:MAG: hypothetical protein EOO75_07100 [Myxococcales bacterium]|nr:MAG: hypothetical protein EOO75_07100 [Myxococcales bacterium]